MNSNEAISVRQLNIYVKSLLENDPRLSSCRVTGEITNFKRHYASGHLYFTLSDGEAAIKCVMFKGYAERCRLELKDGVKVVIQGRVSIYEKDGGYQLYAEYCEEDGVGDKLIALKLLKEKLSKEGLFDIDSKRKIPVYPRRIAIITSGTGAALQDIINVISRRFPVCELVLCSASVQGTSAAKELIYALNRVYDLADMIDTVIIGRGGGSSEDLDAFNDEALARKIFESPIPVISAVGHQTDITICDMVADLRAPTPSAAAELAVPNSDDVIRYLSVLKNKCLVSLTRQSQLLEAKINGILSRHFFVWPMHIVEEKALLVDTTYDKIQALLKGKAEKDAIRFSGILSRIEALSPLKTMARGFVFAETDGNPLSCVSQVQKGDDLTLHLKDGKIGCRVLSKEN